MLAKKLLRQGAPTQLKLGDALVAANGTTELVLRTRWRQLKLQPAARGSKRNDPEPSDVVHTEGGPLRLTRPPKNRKGLDLGRDEQDRIAKAVGF